MQMQTEEMRQAAPEIEKIQTLPEQQIMDVQACQWIFWMAA